MTDVSSTSKTFTGSCHCGKVSYDVLLTLPEQPVAFRCNCTVCNKPGFTTLRVAPSDFTLKTPSTKLELSTYSYRTKDVRRYFCDKCGVQVFGEGKYELQGALHEFFSVNLHTLDQPQDGLELSRFKMEYGDGKNDNWAAGRRDVPWPGGCL